MTERVLIYFPPGCYGHFVYWCIKYFSTDEQVPLPFESTGSSHGIRQQSNSYNFNLDHHNYNDIHESEHKLWLTHWHCFDLNDIAKDFDHIIVLHSGNNRLWAANNDLTKTKLDFVDPNATMANDQQKQIFHAVNDRGDLFEKYYQSSNWEKLRLWCNIWGKFDTDDMQTWQLREKLSFWDSKDLFGYNTVINEQLPKHSTVFDITELKDNFTITIRRMMRSLNIPVLKNTFDSIHQTWIDKQQHHNKDQLVRMVAESITDTNNFALDNLTCLDEIAIQHNLRIKGYEIQCDGLNTFPATMNELRKIIYKV